MSCQGQASFLVICADALRPDYLGRVAPNASTQVSPQVDAFAAQAGGVPRAYSPATWTLPAHVSLFTGLHPHQHGYGVKFKVGRVYPPPAHLSYLPRYLQEQRIAAYGFHNGGIMEPGRALGLGWRSYIGSEPGDVEGPATKFAEAVADLEWPFFAFVHTYAVHNYWGESQTPMALDFLDESEIAELQHMSKEWRNLRWLMAASVKGEQPVSSRMMDIIRRVYLGAVRRFDRLFGMVAEEMGRCGRWEDCYVLLISDHGEALGEMHGGVQHWSHMTVNVHEENIRVPFILKWAQHSKARLDVPVSLVDVPNLVAECLGLPAVFPRRPSGIIFATGATDQFGGVWERAMPPEQRVYRSGLIAGDRKYVLAGGDFELVSVYDLASDPGEDATRVKDLLGPFVGTAPPVPEAGIQGEDAQMLEALRDLGYVD